MLNYIWAGLIILSLLFALITDVSDLSRDTYRNGAALPVEILFEEGYDPAARTLPVQVVLEQTTLEDHFGMPVAVAERYEGRLSQSEDGQLLHFAEDVPLPEPLATIRSITSSRDNDLRGEVSIQAAAGTQELTTGLQFEPVRFVKMAAITQAAFDFAETAVSLAIGLIGVLALWMGLLRIAETSGMLHGLVRFTQPLLRRLFPELPPDHPATGMIVLNLTANMLGLGNAATPLGIKAMESLQTLNPQKDTATNSMVMLLAMNTASVQIVPPALLVAIMGLQVNQLFFSILLTTFFSLIIAIISAKFFGRMRRYRSTDPMLTDDPA